MMGDRRRAQTRSELRGSGVDFQRQARSWAGERALTPGGLRAEAVQLASLIREIRAWLGNSSGHVLDELLDSIDALSSAENLDDGQVERELDRVAMTLRLTWLSHTTDVVVRDFRSPVGGTRRTLPSGATLSYAYERNIDLTPLEERWNASASPVPGWSSQSVLFSSGMAALSVVGQCAVRSVCRARQHASIAMFGAYFETTMLLEHLTSPSVSSTQVSESKHLGRLLGVDSPDILLFEPVSYDSHLGVLDVEELLRLWYSCSREPSIVLIDTTLVGHRFPLDLVLGSLSRRPPALVVEIASGLKLHQQGLELANCGLTRMWHPLATNRHGPDSAVRFVNYVRSVRTIQGATPSLEQVTALDLPVLMDASWTQQYADRVFSNNESLARRITPGGLCQRVVHPSISEFSTIPWAVGPFVIIQLAEDTLENHAFLLGVVGGEAKRRGLALTVGSSFGFRSHRVEVIILRKPALRGLFKVAMGANAGPSAEGIGSLLEEALSFTDFDALRKAFPDAKPVEFDDAFLAFSDMSVS